MYKLDKMLMFKNLRSGEEVNDIFFIIKELDDHYIVKKYDTVREEDMGFEVLEKDYVEKNLYTVEDFFENASYIGKSGFYKGMTDFEKYISESLVVVYKDEFNDVLYDTLLENFFVSPSVYPIEDFVPYKCQNTRVRFKKGLGKK